MDKTHRVRRIDDLMYKGCESHWKCEFCGECVPFHCYTKEQIEAQACPVRCATEIEFEGQIYPVLDCTTEHFVCPPLHKDEGYHFISISKAKITRRLTNA